METRICKKCLLRDGNLEHDRGYVLRYRDNLSEEDRAEEACYEKRLAACQSCELLLQAMCRGCGCYVELRAALKKQSCPYGKWAADKT